MKNLLLGLLTIIAFSFTACEKSNSISEDGALVPLTVMEDSSIPSITINGVQLHAETFGDPSDPILLMIHGGPGADYRSILNFKDLANDDLFVVFYDQRGSGLSERLDASTYSSVQIYIDELDGVINHYRQDADQKVILAGHSWGAMLATAYINQNPDKISGAILAEPGGFTWTQVETYFSESRQLQLFDEFTNDFVYQDQFITGDDHNTLDYKLALSLAGNVLTGDAELPDFWRYGAICNSASLTLAMENQDQMNFTTNLDSYNSKVLFAYSELNPAYGLEHAKEVSAAISNVELVEIKGCGHEIPQYGWDNFYPIIKNYLEEIM